MATPNTIRVELVWRLSGVDWAVNVLHYTTASSDPVDSTDAAAFASAIGTAFTATGLRANYPNTVTLDRARIRDIRTDGNQVFEPTINLAGTAGSGVLPPQTCEVTTLRTSTFSRRGRGRIYWPALSIGTVASSGQISSAAVTDLNDMVTSLLSISASTHNPSLLGVLSRVDNVTRTVQTFNTDTSYDVQTRRRDLAI